MLEQHFAAEAGQHGGKAVLTWFISLETEQGECDLNQFACCVNSSAFSILFKDKKMTPVNCWLQQRPAAATAQPSGSIDSASFRSWEVQQYGGVGMIRTFLHSGEVSPLLRRQLHLGPHNLKRDAVTVRRVRRLKHRTNNCKYDWDKKWYKKMLLPLQIYYW